MKMLDAYLLLQEEIHKYFGYVEDWRILPIIDCREFWWTLKAKDGEAEVVQFAEEIATLKSVGDFYEYAIFKQRHLPKWIYRGDEFTMVVSNTKMDGNYGLAIFDNEKEVTSKQS